MVSHHELSNDGHSTVVKFPPADGADEAWASQRPAAAGTAAAARRGGVSWLPTGRKPRTRERHGTKKAGALGGGLWELWGLLFGQQVIHASLSTAEEEEAEKKKEKKERTACGIRPGLVTQGRRQYPEGAQNSHDKGGYRLDVCPGFLARVSW